MLPVAQRRYMGRQKLCRFAEHNKSEWPLMTLGLIMFGEPIYDWLDVPRRIIKFIELRRESKAVRAAANGYAKMDKIISKRNETKSA
jgi:hypothetical protein